MAVFEKKLRSIANTIKDSFIKKYVLEYFLEKISELTPHTTQNKNYLYTKKSKSLETTKKYFNDICRCTFYEHTQMILGNHMCDRKILCNYKHVYSPNSQSALNSTLRHIDRSFDTAICPEMVCRNECCSFSSPIGFYNVLSIVIILQLA